MGKNKDYKLNKLKKLNKLTIMLLLTTLAITNTAPIYNLAGAVTQSVETVESESEYSEEVSSSQQTELTHDYTQDTVTSDGYFSIKDGYITGLTEEGREYALINGSLVIDETSYPFPVRIKEGAFVNENLREVYLTGVTDIQDGAFNSNKLEYVQIDSVEDTGTEVFANNPNLTQVTIENSPNINASQMLENATQGGIKVSLDGQGYTYLKGELSKVNVNYGKFIGTEHEEEGMNTYSMIRNTQDSGLATASTDGYVLAKDSDFSGSTNGSFRYTGSGGNIEIPHVIKGVKVTSYANMFNNMGQGVKGVKSTNKNITNMSGMFNNFKGNRTLDVSQLDTSGVINMNAMFHGTSHGLNTITTIIGLENFDTSKVTNFGNMFWRSTVTDLRVHNFDTGNATHMNRMFGDSLVTNLDLTGFDTSKVLNMSGMFLNSKMGTLDLRSFNTSKVIDMYQMFQGANTSTVLTGNGFETPNVTNMNNMFANSNISNMSVEMFNTERVINMNYMFSNTRFKTLDLTGYDTRNVESMAYMFEDSRATTIKLGGKFNTQKVTTMNSMFRNTMATSLDLSNFNTSNVTDMIYMFLDSKATTLNLGNNFNTGNVEKMSQMFKGSRASSLKLTGFNTENVSDMGEMFQGSYAKELDLTSFNTSRITNMSNMFNGARATVIKLGNFDTTFVTDMRNMFKDTKVNEIDLRSFDTASVNNTDDMFKGTTATRVVARSSMDYNKLNGSIGKPSGLKIDEFYTQATDEDFSGFYNGNFRYTGNSEYVEIPHTIKGTKMTSYDNLFENTSVKGVISTNEGIVSMNSMFLGNTSKELDVSGLNTQNVVSMNSMFKNTQTNELDLRNFATTKVKGMSAMFENTKVNGIDLGSFDLTSKPTTDNMFKGSTATEGYARTQTEVELLNKTSNKPAGLTFTVWGIVTEQDIEEWTNENINITINAVSGNYGIDYVEMVNESGRNYALNSQTPSLFSSNNHVTAPASYGLDKNIGARWVSGRQSSTDKYYLSMYVSSTFEGGRGVHYSEDLYPVPDTITYSLDVMSPQPIKVRFRTGTLVTLKPNQWTRITKTGTSYLNRPEGIETPVQGDIPLGTRLYYRNFKIEIGDTASPWTPAPEDSESSTDQTDTFPIYTNGTYIFRATDNNGDTKTIAHTVTNIDTTPPTATLTPSTTGWTPQDVTIYTEATDDLSGIDYITLPDNTKVNATTNEYVVTENGDYTFKITDKAGNTTTETITVSNIDRSRPELNASLDNKNWTRDPVNLRVTSEQSASGLIDIEMVSIPRGRGTNLAVGTNTKKWIVWTQTNNGGVNLSYKDEGDSLVVRAENSGNTEVSRMAVHQEELNMKLKRDTDYVLSYQARGNVEELDYTYLMEDAVNSNQSIGSAGKLTTEWKTYHILFRKNHPTSINSGVLLGTKDASAKEWFEVKNIKVEEGTSPTKWTPAPEDIKLVGNAKTYPIITNGLYTYKSTYNNGATSETSINVTNIDLDAPRVEIKDNPTDWEEDDTITLTVNASDNNQSGIQSIQLPDGTKVTNSNTAKYEVDNNGTYEFIVTDKVGNTTIKTETVEYMMIDYYFTIKDSNNKPIQGAKFELLREEEDYKLATSDKDGLVDFGKIPPVGRYQIRQLSAPEGVAVKQEDILAPDNATEIPIEMLTYPRGDEMPATGTTGMLLTSMVVTVGVSLIGYIEYKRKQVKE